MVSVGLGEVLLEESKVLLNALTAFGRSNSLGSRTANSGLLSVELGELGSEVGGKRGSGRGLGGSEAADRADVGISGLLMIQMLASMLCASKTISYAP